MWKTIWRTCLSTALLLTFSFPLFAAEPKEAKPVGRSAKDAADLNYWLANMAAHQFQAEELAAALNLSQEQATNALEKAKAAKEASNKLVPATGSGQIVVLPYPGGRHPRIGFLDGAIDPQRETKASVFAPWKDGGYLVIDLPEAVWHLPAGNRELLYLAHTHIPTIWDKQGVKLPPLEWKRDLPGNLSLVRELPSKVGMTSRIKTTPAGVRLEFSLTNGSAEKLTGLQVQMCAMLKGLTGFEEQINDNKVFAAPFAACKSRTDNRWVILGFDHCVRAWGNPPCPCLHADPQVPDCAPGETQTVHGWISFYEGTEIQPELKRLEKIAFEPIGK